MEISPPSGRWPTAAFGHSGRVWQSAASPWPELNEYQHLAEFIDVPAARPLSHRAASGFLERLDQSNLKVDPRFLRDVEAHVRQTRPTMPRRRRASAASPTGEVPADSWASSPEARRRMQANRARDTKPEVALRRALHARGLRYRVQARPTKEIRNRIDITFGPARVAVDVRGCFWHACPTHATKPKTNALIWAEKLERNAERDNELAERLAAAGWHLEVVWEHEDPLIAADRIKAIVNSRRRNPAVPLMPTAG